MLGCVPRPGPLTSRSLLCEGYSRVYGGTLPVETPRVFDSGDSSGTSPDQEGGHDGCITAGVGCHPRIVNRVWAPQLRFTHINCLELLAVSLALRHFLPLIRGHHVLVRSDNTTVVAYINRQGGLRSARLHTLAHRLILWGRVHLLSLRATQVPGVRNWRHICSPEAILFTENGNSTQR